MLNLNSHQHGMLWFFASLLVSIANNIITKLLGQTLSTWQISGLRLGLGTLLLLPFVIYKQFLYSTHQPKEKHFLLHIVRGVIFFLAIYAWNKGVCQAPIATATLMSFIIPVFVLIFSGIFLKEPVGGKLWLATATGFAGALITLYPISFQWDGSGSLFLGAALLFATLDVINKKYVDRTSMLSMLFYASFIASALFAWPTWRYWKTLTTMELLLSLLLGAGGNLILYCLLKAFALTEASRLQPLRYFELILSFIIGYLYFSEVPQAQSILGACFIVPSSLYIILQK